MIFSCTMNYVSHTKMFPSTPYAFSLVYIILFLFLVLFRREIIEATVFFCTTYKKVKTNRRPRKVILITNIGEKLDDILSLFALTHCHETDLVAVITTEGNTVNRCRLVHHWLNQCRVDTDTVQCIPDIACEANNELSCFMPSQLDSWKPSMMSALVLNNNSEDKAVQCLLNSAKLYGEELFIVCVGSDSVVSRAYIQDVCAMENVGGIFTRLHHPMSNRTIDKMNQLKNNRIREITKQQIIPIEGLVEVCRKEQKKKMNKLGEYYFKKHQIPIFKSQQWFSFVNELGKPYNTITMMSLLGIQSPQQRLEEILSVMAF